MKRFGIVALTTLALLIGETAHAAEPGWWTQQKRQCGLPPSLAYNTWAAQGYPCGGATQPAQDPRVALHNRVSAVISANSDLVDGSALTRANLWDDDAFARLIAGVHRDLWRARSGFDGLTADRRWVMSYYAPHLARLEAYASSLNAARADLVPRNVVEARDRAQAAEAAARAETARITQRAINETLGTVGSAAIWESERNEALAEVRTHFPQADGLPASTDEDAAGSIVERLHVPPGPYNVLSLYAEPTLQPMIEGVLAPAWNPDGLVYRHAAPLAEPPAPATLQEQVSELERMAGDARAAKARAAGAAQELSALEERYRSYYKIAEKGQDAVAQMEAETNLAKSRLNWLAAARRNAEVNVRNAVWQRVYATSKALVWGAMKGRVVPDALNDLAHAAPVEKARKYQALVDRILSIESDFELYSPQAAEVLAQGSPAEAQHVLDGVWGTSRAEGRETMQKALDAADAPESLRKAWGRLIGDGAP
jgi:hypothetical protein